MADWQPDVLGDDYEQLTLPLAPDEEGEVVATLVRRRRPGPDPYLDVLYVHGWSDYFFQTELADFWEAHGARFHALDLRKYGRSLRPGQTPGFVADLATYDEDIEAALVAMGHRGDGRSRRAVGRRGPSPLRLSLCRWRAGRPGRRRGARMARPARSRMRSRKP